MAVNIWWKYYRLYVSFSLPKGYSLPILLELDESPGKPSQEFTVEKGSLSLHDLTWILFEVGMVEESIFYALWRTFVLWIFRTMIIDRRQKRNIVFVFLKKIYCTFYLFTILFWKEDFPNLNKSQHEFSFLKQHSSHRQFLFHLHFNTVICWNGKWILT